MTNGEKTSALRTKSSAVALALLFCGWCATSTASNGLDAICGDAEFSLVEATVPLKPSLSSHTEDAIDGSLDQDSAQLAALGAASAEQSGDKFDDTEDATEQLQSNETPAVTTRLPGVSDTAISGFRRQMLRTDI